MVKNRKKMIIRIGVCIFLLTLIIWTLWGNTALKTTEYVIESENIPKEFDGFIIAQISDLHNAEMGKDNKKLLSILEKSEPDIIAITGDVIDCNRTDIVLCYLMDSRTNVGSLVHGWNVWKK